MLSPRVYAAELDLMYGEISMQHKIRIYYDDDLDVVMYEYDPWLAWEDTVHRNVGHLQGMTHNFTVTDEDGDIGPKVLSSKFKFYPENIVKALEQTESNKVQNLLIPALFTDKYYTGYDISQYESNIGSETSDGTKLGESPVKMSDHKNYGVFVRANGTSPQVVLKTLSNSSGNMKEVRKDITSLIDKFEVEGFTTDNIPAKAVVDSIIDAKSNLKEKIEENIKTEETERLAVDIANFDSLPEVDKWATAIKNYLVNGSAIKDHEDYDVSVFPGNMTQTEKLLVNVYADILSTTFKSDFTLPSVFDNSTAGPIQLDKITGYTIGTINPITAEDAIKTANVYSKKAYDKLEFSNVVSEPKYVALYFDYIARYLVPDVYGFEYKNQVTDTEENISFVSLNEKLELVIPRHILNNNVPIKLLDSIPIFTSIQSVENIDRYTDLYLSVFYADSFVSSTLTMDDQGNYTNSDLDLLGEVTEGQEVPLSNLQKDVLIAYKSYLDGLEYLGILPDSFTDTMDAVKGYLNKYGHLVKSIEVEDYVPSDNEPLSVFFNVEQAMLSKYYSQGVALSATFLPLKTNLFDAHTYTYIRDKKFIDTFHYPYGFHRKALYMSTDADAAVNRYISGVDKSTRKPATLKDLLQPDADVVLYLDDNFYNIDVLSDIQGDRYEMSNNGEEGEDTGSIWDKISDVANIRVQKVVKTGADSIYLDKVAAKSKSYSSDSSEKTNSYDEAILSASLIDEYVSDSEYSEMQSFAVVSGIYRDKNLFKIVQNESIKDNPVFVSSPNLAGIVGVDAYNFNTIYNYSLLKNITKSIGVDVDTALDMDAPIFIDIYGNICTASGLVVIPAAANATLHSPEAFNVYNAAFLTTYGDYYYIPGDYNNTDKKLTKFFYMNEEENIWVLQDKSVNGLYLDFGNLPYSDKNVLDTLRKLYEQDIVTKLPFNNRARIITEVMRGAPLEYIDLEKEGLVEVTEVSNMGLYTAYKLDILSDEILANIMENTLVAFPNLAHVEGIEYIVVFLFKALFISLFVVLFIQVYMDAIRRSLGFKTIGKFVLVVSMITASFWVFPKLLEYSYYLPNKILLQDAMHYLMILDVEKKAEGREIGVTSVGEPQSDTELYIKLDNVGVSWVDVIDEVLFAPTFTTVQEAYEKEFTNNLLAGQEGVEVKSDGLFMSVDTIMNSSSIEFNSSKNFIYQKVLGDPVASFSIPYYVVLDQLIGAINNYNLKNNILSYDTRIMDKGNVATVGLIEPYLTSKFFMDIDKDILGLGEVYDLDKAYSFGEVFTEEQLDQMRESRWFVVDSYDYETTVKKLDKLSNKARKYVTDNRHLLGKVTDETFLKCMAMYLALEHNREFNVPGTSSLEIFGLDNRDLIRFTLAEPNEVLELATTSFGRFTYELGGGFLVLITAALIIVYCIGSIVKPGLMCVMLAAVLFSIFWHKLVLRQENKSIQGYLVSFCLVCVINLIYALLLCISIFIPRLGIPPLVCGGVQIVLHVLYLMGLCKIAGIVLSDLYNIGFGKYATMFINKAKVNINKATIVINNAVVSNRNEYEQDGVRRGLSDYDVDATGEDYLREMYRRDRERNGAKWNRNKRRR